MEGRSWMVQPAIDARKVEDLTSGLNNFLDNGTSMITGHTSIGLLSVFLGRHFVTAALPVSCTPQAARP